MQLFFKYSVISLLGLVIDFFVYLTLLRVDIGVFVSSFLGSLAAVTFVFFVTNLHVFRNSSSSIKKYTIWLIYQIFNTLFFAFVVKLLFLYGFNAIFSKIITVPFSFSLNFMVSKLLSKLKL
jgi:putative flippase GtrA